MSKRDRDEEVDQDQVLLILENDSPPSFVYTAPLSYFTEADLKALSRSLPSDRINGPLKGCHGDVSDATEWSELDRTVWTNVGDPEDVWSLKNIRRVVMAFAYE